MKVALCARQFGGVGGQEGFLQRLAAHLVGGGHEVVVLALAGEPAPGVELKLVPLRRPVTGATKAWQCGRVLAAELARTSCDVSFGAQKTWNCNVLRPGGGVEAEYWRVRLGGRRDAWLGPLRRWLSVKRLFDLHAERKGYASPCLRRVVANSRLVADGLLRHYPGLAGRVETVYNGADTHRFAPQPDDRQRAATARGLGLDPARLTAIFAGHDFRRKGLRFAIEAIAAVNDASREPVQLIVMGGREDPAYARLARTRGVEGCVRFVGSTREPSRYYAASDFLLFPSFYDPCANVTLEALASGLPVVTSRLNGAHELITPGIEGYVLESPDDVCGMAHAIRRLADKDSRDSMKRAARRLAEAHAEPGKLAAIASLLAASADERTATGTC